MLNHNLKEQLISLAREFGFVQCAFAGITPVLQDAPLHPIAQNLTGDLLSLMPDAACIMLCVTPYQPFDEQGENAQVDAYYVTSNRAHEAIKRLAQRIEETFSIRALATPPVFIKPLAVRSGLGEFGRNALISVGEYGTRVSLQTIALNVPIETDDRTEKRFSAMCAHCNRCVNACPTRALDGSGNINISRCLRAQPENEAFPEELRSQLGASILGCDVCQRVCPRNAHVSLTAPDAALSAALDLSALLRGEYKPLIPYLGKNNARRQRLTARALIAAANLNRRDLLPLVEALTECKESDMVREHAQWAAKQLSEHSSK